jgi:hypothetical protein
MSHLFERLARQSTGAPLPRVHAVARLPFQLAVPGHTSGDLATGPAPQMIPPDSRAQAADAVPPTVTRSERDALGEMMPAPSQEARPLPSDASAREPGRVSAARIRGESAGETAARDQDTRAFPASAKRRRAARLHDIDTPIAPELTASSAHGVDANAPKAAGAPAHVRPRDARRDRPAAEGPPIPPALLPSQPAAPSGAGAPRQAPRAPRARDTAHEVHVHIGRIEVTAVQDAPATRPRAPRMEPMSLDDYLAGRQQGRS